MRSRLSVALRHQGCGAIASSLAMNRITRHLIEELSWRVFVFDRGLCRFTSLDGVGRLDWIRKRAWIGYNVSPTFSTLWEKRLLCQDTIA